MGRDKKVLRKRRQRYRNAVAYIKEHNLEGIIEPILLSRPINWNFKIEIERKF